MKPEFIHRLRDSEHPDVLLGDGVAPESLFCPWCGRELSLGTRVCEPCSLDVPEVAADRPDAMPLPGSGQARLLGYSLLRSLILVGTVMGILAASVLILRAQDGGSALFSGETNSWMLVFLGLGAVMGVALGLLDRARRARRLRARQRAYNERLRQLEEADRLRAQPRRASHDILRSLGESSEAGAKSS